MKKVGIWMDKEKAHFVWLSKDMEYFETIFSEIEVFRPKGGSGSKATKWGPQDVVQDSKYLEREKHQYRAYFKQLADNLKNVEAIVLFGPAETAEKFEKELRGTYPELAKKVKAVNRADSMTNNQIKKIVREYYGLEPQRN